MAKKSIFDDYAPSAALMGVALQKLNSVKNRHKLPFSSSHTIISSEEGTKITGCDDSPIFSFEMMISDYVVGSVMGRKFLPSDYDGGFLDVSSIEDSYRLRIGDVLEMPEMEKFKREKPLSSQYVQGCCRNLFQIMVGLNPQKTEEAEIIGACYGAGKFLSKTFYKLDQPTSPEDLKSWE